MASFEQQVIAFHRKAERAMTATLRESAQDLVDEALRPRAKGGRMPVDTGFLRNSFVGAIGRFPKGPTGSGGRDSTVGMEPLILAIRRANLGDRLIIGSAANYGKIQESKNGFIRLTAQNWDIICERAARRVRRAIR